MKSFVFLVVLIVAIGVSAKPVKNNKIQRYVVFPGLDADPEELAEWSTGYTTAFNVLFGPKPYVIGWVADDPINYKGEKTDIADAVSEDKKNNKKKE